MNLHPNVHPEWQQWSNEETLHVAVAYSNPFRWRNRRHTMQDFKYHMRHAPNVQLYVGELAYGDRPWEVTDPGIWGDIQLRTSSEMFHKENILNEVIRKFPPNWKYGAYIDADFGFTRHDWALEAIHKLQHHAWVQPFSTYIPLGAKKYGGLMPGAPRYSFAYTYWQNGCQVPDNSTVFNGWKGAYYNGGVGWKPVGATGGAWCFTRDAYEAVGGLLDICILGHGDWFMTFGLASTNAPDMHDSQYHPHYIAAINEWQSRARELKQNIGYVDGMAVHHFHGSYSKRGYSTRDMILVKDQFDPVADIRRNYQGIYELTGNKPRLRDDLRAYFISRDEDDPSEE